MSPNQDYSSTPLCIPLHPSIPLCTRQVDLMARSLQRVGIRRALVVHSKGLDEISPMGMSVLPSTWIVSLPHGSVTLPHGSVSLPHGSVTLPHESLSPIGPADVTQDSVRPFGVIHSFSSPCRLSPAPVAVDYGIARCTIEDLKGGVKALNAQQVAIADALSLVLPHLLSSFLLSLQVLNAGTGLAACGVAKDVGEGIAMAQEAQRSGKAISVLDQWAALSQELKKAEQLAVA
ncbi:unnamed protein product [Closterium sp. NIES-64]|nr:unnamed protein product [Closterium sp. NIES-64]